MAVGSKTEVGDSGGEMIVGVGDKLLKDVSVGVFMLLLRLSILF